MVAELPPVKRKTQRNQHNVDIDWDLIESLYAQGLPPSQIAIKTGFKYGTITAGATQRGLVRKRKEAQRVMSSDRNAGDRLKVTLGHVAQDVADELAVKTPKNTELLNLHVDSALKTAKLGATIYGWDSDRTVGLVALGIIGERDEEAIDVPSVTQSDNE